MEMNTSVEKRAYKRHCFAADIAFCYFNNESSYQAHTLNIGTGGMCFKSDRFLKPGATICLRLIKTHPNDASIGFCEGLHIVALAEVKWCRESKGAGAFPYGVGVKYFEAAF